MTVRFDESKNIEYIITNNKDEERSLGSAYWRGLINLCETAERDLVKILNDNCKNKIILVQENTLTVRDLDKDWYEDDTIVNFVNYIKQNNEFREYFCKLFDQEVDSKLISMTCMNMNIILNNIKFSFSKVLKL